MLRLAYGKVLRNIVSIAA